MIPGVPTALSAHETRILQQYAQGKRVIEAGALLGYSTIALAQVAASVVSIDRHIGYSGDTYRPFMSNLIRAGVDSKVLAVQGDATSHLPHYVGGLAFIDLTCTFDLTKEAAHAALTPLVAIHDFARPHCGGVGRVVDALVKRAWRIVERADTLIVLARPAKETQR